MPRTASSMPCLLLTVVCTRAAAVQEASCATYCGFSWRLLLSWACVGIIPHGLVQQGAPEPLFDGSEMVVRSALRDGALTVGKSMLRHSLSGGYGVSGAGCGHRDTGTCRPLAGEAVSGRDRRWEAAVDGSSPNRSYARLNEM